MQIRRPFLASLIAPMAALLPILLLSAYELTQPVAIINGEPDNAPQRAIGVLLASLPVIYVVLALVAHGVGTLFIRLGFGTFGKFLLGSVLLAIVLSLPLSLRTTPDFGLQDRLISLMMFAVAALITVIPGACCWFLIARERSQPRDLSEAEGVV